MTRTATHGAEDNSRPKQEPKLRQRPKARTSQKKSLYEKETKVDHPSLEVANVKAKSSRRGAALDNEDGQVTLSKSKNGVKSTVVSKTATDPDSDDASPAMPPSKRVTKTKASSGKAVDKASAKGSSKRSPGTGGGQETDFEESIPPRPSRKRANAISSDDDTLVETARSKSVGTSPLDFGTGPPPRV